MAIALNPVKVLQNVYSPTYEMADEACLPIQAGLVRVTPVANYQTLVYRSRKKAGGVLGEHKPGEKITASNTGLDYQDELVTTYGFSDAEYTLAKDIYGLQSLNTLNPEVAQSIGEVAAMHSEVLLTKWANTARLFAALAVLPSITVGSSTYENKVNGVSKVEAVDVTGANSYTTATGAWATTSTDIPAILRQLKRNFFGSSLTANGITLLVRQKQMDEIRSNAKVIEAAKAAQGVSVDSAGAAQIQEIEAIEYFARENISILKWEDQYRTASNSDPYDNLSAFLTEDRVVAIPRSYYVSNPVSPLSPLAVAPGANAAPFAEILIAPEPDFMNKAVPQMGLNVEGIGSVPGMYYSQGWEGVYDRLQPDTFVTAAASRFGVFTEASLKIKYLTVN